MQPSRTAQSRLDPHLRDRLIDREIETTLRRIAKAEALGIEYREPRGTFGVLQPYNGRRRDYGLPAEPTVEVCLYVPPPYPQRPLIAAPLVDFYLTKGK